MTQASRTLQRSFAGGEIAPELYGRLDLTKHQTGLARCRNMQTLPHGPVQSRAGLRYVLRTKDSTKAARLIEFTYNVEQTYIIELGDQYARFHTNSATLLSDAQAITGVTQANPAVLTYSGDDFTNGQWVFIDDVAGMTQLNGRWFIVANVNTAANTFELHDLDGLAIDASSYTAYSSGGTVSPIVEIETPYLEADLFDIHYTQSADVMTLVHPSYEVRELSRLSATEWSLDTVDFDNDIAAPTGLSIDTHAGSGLSEVFYRVFPAIDTLIGNPTPHAVVRIDRATTQVTLRWPAPAGPSASNPTKYIVTVSTGTGYFKIGETTALSFVDNNLALGATEIVATGYVTVPRYLTAETVTTNPSSYVVTAVAAGFLEESDPSPSLSVNNDLTAAGAYNLLSWSAVEGAVRYRVYKRRSGLLGFIGETPELTFKDNNITADLTQSPPEGGDPFRAAGDYPRAVGYFQGRRFFGGMDNDPQALFGSRSGTESNMTYSIPAASGDTIRARIAARSANVIRHFVPLRDLLILTSGAEWLARSDESGVLTPASVSFQVQGYVGASDVQPVVTSAAVVYAQDRGGRINQMLYSLEQDGYQTSDISLMAPHLFDGYTITQIALQRSPHQTVWVVRSDGVLLGCTYLPEHEVLAWHPHETDGEFESVAVVAEGDYDAVYAVVRRDINGGSVRYVERLADRKFATRADSFCVDAGLTYDGDAATTITGLWHLEGEAVAVLADGAVVDGLTVSNGSITLDSAASKVHVGLPMPDPQAQTLPFAYESAAAFGQGNKKNVSRVFFRLVESGGVFAGPDFDNLTELKVTGAEELEDPPELQNGLVELVITPTWGLEGQVCFAQTAPLPLEVAAMVLEVASGG